MFQGAVEDVWDYESQVIGIVTPKPIWELVRLRCSSFLMY